MNYKTLQLKEDLSNKGRGGLNAKLKTEICRN